MKHAFVNRKIIAGSILLSFVIVALSWQPKTRNKQTDVQSAYGACYGDTTKPGAKRSDEIDIRLNFDSVSAVAQAAIANIDMAVIQENINRSLANINFDAMNKSVESSLKNIDWTKMQVDVTAALNKAKAEIAKIDTKQLTAQIEAVKKQLNSEQFKKFSSGEFQKELTESLKNAQHNIEKAKEQMANYKAFISQLQKDGLIDADKPYSIQLKDDYLYINGIKQSKEITEKYSKYYMNQEKFTLRNNDDNTDDNSNTTDL